MPHITLLFRDGHETRIAAEPGETILGAALRQGLPLIHQCESGSCGTCVVRLAEGEVETLPGRALALLEGEIRDGHRLACSVRPVGDCAVALDYPISAIAGPRPEIHRAAVGAVERIARSVYRLDLDVIGDLSFAAGQYVRIRVPGADQWRSYSMATTPKALPALGFLIRHLDGGAMSEWLAAGPAAGTEIEIEGPHGAFGLDDDCGPTLMIAGGTGLAPLLSMLDTLRERAGPAPPVVLGFGCNAVEELFFLDELELRAFWMPSLAVRIAVMTAPEAGFDGRVGDAVSLIDLRDTERPGLTAYLCGPPGMIEAARARLVEGGLPSERIRAEQFRPSEA